MFHMDAALATNITLFKTTVVCPKHRNSKSTLPETSKTVDFVTQNLLGPKLSSQKFTLPKTPKPKIYFAYQICDPHLSLKVLCCLANLKCLVQTL